MKKRLSNWLNQAYEVLWKAFEDREFRFQEAAKVLESGRHIPAEQVNVVLAELRKAGRLSVKHDASDRRRRIYRLLSLQQQMQQELLGSAVRENEKSLGRNELEALLKRAADLIRTRVDYRYILLLLFYKRICDKWRVEFEKAKREAIEDGFTPEEAEAEARRTAYHDFDIPDEFLWDNLRKDLAHLPENLSRAFKAIAEHNPDLRLVFENVDFLQFTQSYENAELLRQLFELFSSYSLEHVSPDILGDAYEWILRYFAPQKAKEGEVYTPREVIRLMVKILEPKPGESVYDPACGSGGMLIMAYKYVEKLHGRDAADRLFLYGQEANLNTLTLARMNLYIHDIQNADIQYGDTLLHPKFKDGGKLKRFDVLLTNPPWNQKGYDEKTVKRGEFVNERFPFGFTTRQSADWLWIQHLIASAKPQTGRIAVVIDNGALFRSGREKAIRKAAIELDMLDAVILLPEKLFYNTGAPGAILIFLKNKPAERKKKVIFINASKEFEQHPEVRKLNRLGDKHIDKIVEAYREFKEEEGFCKIVETDEIRENDYNLNVTLYAYPIEEEEKIDIPAEWQALKQLDKELSEVEQKIDGYLKELGYGI